MIGAGLRVHRVSLYGTTTTGSQGDPVVTATALSPATAWAEIVPASARQLERILPSAVVAMATHVVTMPYHSGVTTQTRILFGARTFNVIGVMSPGERQIETVAVCAEVVT